MEAISIAGEMVSSESRSSALIEELASRKHEYPCVSFWLSAVDVAEVRIETVWSEQERGRGHATAAMRLLSMLADRHQVAISLVPHWLAYDTGLVPDEAEADRLDALNETRLGNDELADWYGRLGYTKTGKVEFDDPVMLRLPSPATGSFGTAAQ